MILALTLDDCAGWCVGEPGGRPFYGAWCLPDISEQGRQADMLDQELSDAITVHSPRSVFVQAPAGITGGLAGVRQQFGMVYLAGLICHRREVRLTEYSLRDSRMAVLGRCNGVKPKDVIAWCNGKGWPCASEAAADAVLLWFHACRQGSV